MLYTKQEWFKTRAEMNEVFADVPEALENTCELADKTENYSIDHGPIMPNFEIPEDLGEKKESFESEEEAAAYVMPDWFLEDVTFDHRYSNAVMTRYSSLKELMESEE